MKRAIPFVFLAVLLGVVIAKFGLDYGWFGTLLHYHEFSRQIVVETCQKMAQGEGYILQGVDVSPGLLIQNFSSDVGVCHFDKGNIAWNVVYDLKGNFLGLQ